MEHLGFTPRMFSMPCRSLQATLVARPEAAPRSPSWKVIVVNVRPSSPRRSQWVGLLCTRTVPKACPNEVARAVVCWLVVARKGSSEYIPFA